MWQYAALLQRLGVESKVMLDDWRVLIQGREDIERYARSVGFLPGVYVGKNSRYWQGYAKGEVLKLLLGSYGNPKSIYNLPKFSSGNQG